MVVAVLYADGRVHGPQEIFVQAFRHSAALLGWQDSRVLVEPRLAEGAAGDFEKLAVVAVAAAGQLERLAPVVAPAVVAEESAAEQEW